MIEGYKVPFGYVHSSFVKDMSWPEAWALDHESRTLTLSAEKSFDKRTEAMDITLREGVDKGEGSVYGLGNWCNELFPVYAVDGEHVMDMDGCGVDPFGIKSFAVHLTAYVKTEDGTTRYWVPRRAKTKRTYPGILDNSVGGSLASREQSIDCIVREAAEEASLPPEFTRARIKACGALSYQMTSLDNGQPGCQHQYQYVYEMELPLDVTPTPCDGEVEEFKLMTIEEVQDALARGEFKLNCAMTWMAYFIRHGILAAENEPDFLEICARLHRKHDLFIV